MLRFALCVSLLAIAPALLLGLSQDDEEPPVRMGPGVTPPHAISKVEPNYTPQARDAHIEGAVVFQILIHKDGHVTCTKLVKALGYGLDETGRMAVEQWKFAPAQKDGKPVSFATWVEVNFRLSGKEHKRRSQESNASR